MEQFLNPIVGSRLDSHPDTGPARGMGGPERAQPYPADKLEREQAALDLADASQAATRAARLHGRNESAESLLFALLAQRLYAQADAHGRAAAEARHRPQSPPTALGREEHTERGLAG